MKQKTITIGILSLLLISFFFTIIPFGRSEEPVYSPNTQIIESWLKPTLYLVNDKPAQGGVDQVTANGLKYRVILGGVRLENTEDKGKVELGEIKTEIMKGDVIVPSTEKVYGFYKRYNMRVDILIRTLATKNDVVGPSVTESSITTRLIDYNFRKEVLTTYKSTPYDFTVTNYVGLDDWRTYAAREYSAALGIRLSSDPSFQFPQSFDAQNGIYKLNGIWAGIVKVETPSNPAYEYGLLKDNIAIQSYVGTNLVSDSSKNIAQTSVSEPKPDSTEIGSATKSFIIQADVGTPSIVGDSEGYIVDFVYKQSQYPFDLYETSKNKFNFQYDPSITNKNYSDVYFPYNFRLKPETTVYSSIWPYTYAKIYTNLIGPGLDFTGCDEGSLTTPGLTVTSKTAYKVDNVWQKSSVIASIDIISKYAFQPNLPNQPPLDKPDEFINQSIWNNIGSGATNVTLTLPTGGGLPNIDWSFLDYLLPITIIALIGIVAYKILKPKPKYVVQK